MALGLQRLLREVKHHRCRILFGLDAQAVLFALRKGRSSAWSLRRAVARCAALTLAGDFLPTYFYSPSELNVADAPSRGAKRVRRTRARKPERRTAEVQSLQRLRSALSRCGALTNSSDYSGLWSERTSWSSGW